LFATDATVLQLVYIRKTFRDHVPLTIRKEGKFTDPETTCIYRRNSSGNSGCRSPVAVHFQHRPSKTCGSLMITTKHCRFAGNSVCYLHRVGRVSGPDWAHRQKMVVEICTEIFVMQK
jgi:hypothetical protein